MGIFDITRSNGKLKKPIAVALTIFAVLSTSASLDAAYRPTGTYDQYVPYRTVAHLAAEAPEVRQSTLVLSSSGSVMTKIYFLPPDGALPPDFSFLSSDEGTAENPFGGQGALNAITLEDNDLKAISAENIENLILFGKNSPDNLDISIKQVSAIDIYGFFAKSTKSLEMTDLRLEAKSTGKSYALYIPNSTGAVKISNTHVKSTAANETYGLLLSAASGNTIILEDSSIQSTNNSNSEKATYGIYAEGLLKSTSLLLKDGANSDALRLISARSTETGNNATTYGIFLTGQITTFSIDPNWTVEATSNASYGDVYGIHVALSSVKPSGGVSPTLAFANQVKVASTGNLSSAANNAIGIQILPGNETAVTFNGTRVTAASKKHTVCGIQMQRNLTGLKASNIDVTAVAEDGTATGFDLSMANNGKTNEIVYEFQDTKIKAQGGKTATGLAFPSAGSKVKFIASTGPFNVFTRAGSGGATALNFQASQLFYGYTPDPISLLAFSQGGKSVAFDASAAMTVSGLIDYNMGISACNRYFVGASVKDINGTISPDGMTETYEIDDAVQGTCSAIGFYKGTLSIGNYGKKVKAYVVGGIQGSSISEPTTAIVKLGGDRDSAGIQNGFVHLWGPSRNVAQWHIHGPVTLKHGGSDATLIIPQEASRQTHNIELTNLPAGRLELTGTQALIFHLDSQQMDPEFPGCSLTKGFLTIEDGAKLSFSGDANTGYGKIAVINDRNLPLSASSAYWIIRGQKDTTSLSQLIDSTLPMQINEEEVQRIGSTEVYEIKNYSDFIATGNSYTSWNNLKLYWFADGERSGLLIGRARPNIDISGIYISSEVSGNADLYGINFRGSSGELQVKFGYNVLVTGTPKDKSTTAGKEGQVIGVLADNTTNSLTISGNVSAENKNDTATVNTVTKAISANRSADFEGSTTEGAKIVLEGTLTAKTSGLGSVYGIMAENTDQKILTQQDSFITVTDERTSAGSVSNLGTSGIAAGIWAKGTPASDLYGTITVTDKNTTNTGPHSSIYGINADRSREAVTLHSGGSTIVSSVSNLPNGPNVTAVSWCDIPEDEMNSPSLTIENGHIVEASTNVPNSVGSGIASKHVIAVDISGGNSKSLATIGTAIHSQNENGNATPASDVYAIRAKNFAGKLHLTKDAVVEAYSEGASNTYGLFLDGNNMAETVIEAPISATSEAFTAVGTSSLFTRVIGLSSSNSIQNITLGQLTNTADTEQSSGGEASEEIPPAPDPAIQRSAQQMQKAHGRNFLHLPAIPATSRGLRADETIETPGTEEIPAEEPIGLVVTTNSATVLGPSAIGINWENVPVAKVEAGEIPPTPTLTVLPGYDISVTGRASTSNNNSRGITAGILLSSQNEMATAKLGSNVTVLNDNEEATASSIVYGIRGWTGAGGTKDDVTTPFKGSIILQKGAKTEATSLGRGSVYGLDMANGNNVTIEENYPIIVRSKNTQTAGAAETKTGKATTVGLNLQGLTGTFTTKGSLDVKNEAEVGTLPNAATDNAASVTIGASLKESSGKFLFDTLPNYVEPIDPANITAAAITVSSTNYGAVYGIDATSLAGALELKKGHDVRVEGNPITTTAATSSKLTLPTPSVVALNLFSSTVGSDPDKSASFRVDNILWAGNSNSAADSKSCVYGIQALANGRAIDLLENNKIFVTTKGDSQLYGVNLQKATNDLTQLGQIFVEKETNGTAPVYGIFAKEYTGTITVGDGLTWKKFDDTSSREKTASIHVKTTNLGAETVALSLAKTGSSMTTKKFNLDLKPYGEIVTETQSENQKAAGLLLLVDAATKNATDQAKIGGDIRVTNSNADSLASGSLIGAQIENFSTPLQFIASSEEALTNNGDWDKISGSIEVHAAGKGNVFGAIVNGCTTVNLGANYRIFAEAKNSELELDSRGEIKGGSLFGFSGSNITDFTTEATIFVQNSGNNMATPTLSALTTALDLDSLKRSAHFSAPTGGYIPPVDQISEEPDSILKNYAPGDTNNGMIKAISENGTQLTAVAFSNLQADVTMDEGHNIIARGLEISGDGRSAQVGQIVAVEIDQATKSAASEGQANKIILNNSISARNDNPLADSSTTVTGLSVINCARTIQIGPSGKIYASSVGKSSSTALDAQNCSFDLQLSGQIHSDSFSSDATTGTMIKALNLDNASGTFTIQNDGAIKASAISTAENGPNVIGLSRMKTANGPDKVFTLTVDNSATEANMRNALEVASCSKTGNGTTTGKTIAIDLSGAGSQTASNANLRFISAQNTNAEADSSSEVCGIRADSYAGLLTAYRVKAVATGASNVAALDLTNVTQGADLESIAAKSLATNSDSTTTVCGVHAHNASGKFQVGTLSVSAESSQAEAEGPNVIGFRRTTSYSSSTEKGFNLVSKPESVVQIHSQTARGNGTTTGRTVGFEINGGIAVNTADFSFHELDVANKNSNSDRTTSVCGISANKYSGGKMNLNSSVLLRASSQGTGSVTGIDLADAATNLTIGKEAKILVTSHNTIPDDETADDTGETVGIRVGSKLLGFSSDGYVVVRNDGPASLNNETKSVTIGIDAPEVKTTFNFLTPEQPLAADDNVILNEPETDLLPGENSTGSIYVVSKNGGSCFGIRTTDSLSPTFNLNEGHDIFVRGNPEHGTPGDNLLPGTGIVAGVAIINPKKASSSGSALAINVGNCISVRNTNPLADETTQVYGVLMDNAEGPNFNLLPTGKIFASSCGLSDVCALDLKRNRTGTAITGTICARNYSITSGKVKASTDKTDEANSEQATGGETDPEAEPVRLFALRAEEEIDPAVCTASVYGLRLDGALKTITIGDGTNPGLIRAESYSTEAANDETPANTIALGRQIMSQTISGGSYVDSSISFTFNPLYQLEAIGHVAKNGAVIGIDLEASHYDSTAVFAGKILATNDNPEADLTTAVYGIRGSKFVGKTTFADTFSISLQSNGQTANCGIDLQDNGKGLRFLGCIDAVNESSTCTSETTHYGILADGLVGAISLENINNSNDKRYIHVASLSSENNGGSVVGIRRYRSAKAGASSSNDTNYTLTIGRGYEINVETATATAGGYAIGADFSLGLSASSIFSLDGSITVQNTNPLADETTQVYGVRADNYLGAIAIPASGVIRIDSQGRSGMCGISSRTESGKTFKSFNINGTIDVRSNGTFPIDPTTGELVPAGTIYGINVDNSIMPINLLAGGIRIISNGSKNIYGVHMENATGILSAAAGYPVSILSRNSNGQTIAAFECENSSGQLSFENGITVGIYGSNESTVPGTIYGVHSDRALGLTSFLEDSYISVYNDADTCPCDIYGVCIDYHESTSASAISSKGNWDLFCANKCGKAVALRTSSIANGGVILASNSRNENARTSIISFSSSDQEGAAVYSDANVTVNGFRNYIVGLSGTVTGGDNFSTTFQVDEENKATAIRLGANVTQAKIGREGVSSAQASTNYIVGGIYGEPGNNTSLSFYGSTYIYGTITGVQTIDLQQPIELRSDEFTLPNDMQSFWRNEAAQTGAVSLTQTPVGCIKLGTGESLLFHLEHDTSKPIASQDTVPGIVRLKSYGGQNIRPQLIFNGGKIAVRSATSSDAILNNDLRIRLVEVDDSIDDITQLVKNITVDSEELVDNPQYYLITNEEDVFDNRLNSYVCDETMHLLVSVKEGFKGLVLGKVENTVNPVGKGSCYISNKEGGNLTIHFGESTKEPQLTQSDFYHPETPFTGSDAYVTRMTTTGETPIRVIDTINGTITFQLDESTPAIEVVNDGTFTGTIMGVDAENCSAALIFQNLNAEAILPDDSLETTNTAIHITNGNHIATVCGLNVNNAHRRVALYPGCDIRICTCSCKPDADCIGISAVDADRLDLLQNTWIINTNPNSRSTIYGVYADNSSGAINLETTAAISAITNGPGTAYGISAIMDNKPIDFLASGNAHIFAFNGNTFGSAVAVMATSSLRDLGGAVEFDGVDRGTVCLIGLNGSSLDGDCATCGLSTAFSTAPVIISANTNYVVGLSGEMVCKTFGNLEFIASPEQNGTMAIETGGGTIKSGTITQELGQEIISIGRAGSNNFIVGGFANDVSNCTPNTRVITMGETSIWGASRDVKEWDVQGDIRLESQSVLTIKNAILCPTSTGLNDPACAGDTNCPCGENCDCCPLCASENSLDQSVQDVPENPNTGDDSTGGNSDDSGSTDNSGGEIIAGGDETTDGGGGSDPIIPPTDPTDPTINTTPAGAMKMSQIRLNELPIGSIRLASDETLVFNLERKGDNNVLLGSLILTAPDVAQLIFPSGNHGKIGVQSMNGEVLLPAVDVNLVSIPQYCAVEELITGLTRGEHIDGGLYFIKNESEFFDNRLTSYTQISNLHLLWSEIPGREGIILRSSIGEKQRPSLTVTPYGSRYATGELSASMTTSISMIQSALRNSFDRASVPPNQPFLLTFGAHTYQGENNGLGYRNNAYGLALGGHNLAFLNKKLIGTPVRVGALLAYTRSKLDFFGEYAAKGKTARQDTYQVMIFGRYFDLDKKGFTTSITATMGGIFTRNHLWRKVQEGYNDQSFSADFDSKGFYVSLDGTRNMSRLNGYQFGPWVTFNFQGIKHNSLHEKSTAGVTSGHRSLSLMRHRQIAATVGINVEKDVNNFLREGSVTHASLKTGIRFQTKKDPTGHGEDGSNRSATIQNVGIGPFQPVFTSPDSSLFVISGGLKTRMDKNWNFNSSWEGNFGSHYNYNHINFGFEYNF